MNKSVETRTKLGVAWSAATTTIGQVLSFIMGIILARLLLPEDFGVLAAIIIFIDLGSSLVSSGLVSALIQRSSIRNEHYSTAFWVHLFLGVTTCLVLVAIAPHVGEFFHNVVVGEVLAVMAIYMLLLPFISIPTAILRKRIDFRSLGIANLIQQLINGAVSIGFAFWGWGVWSLVYGRLSGYCVNSLYLYLLVRWQPQLRISKQALKELLPFSLKVTAANILNDIAQNIAFVLVGRFIGAAQLGFYHRAYDLMTFPLTRITTSMDTVLYSAFSEVQDDRKVLKKALLKSTSYVLIICAPLLIGLFWVAPAFVYNIYGENWMGVVPPLQIMCFAGLLLAVEPLAVSLITAMGHIGFEVQRQVIYVCVMVIGGSIGSFWGIVGVAYSMLVAAVIFLILLRRLLGKFIQLSWHEYASIFVPVGIGSGIMSLVLWLYDLATRSFFSPYSVIILLTSIAMGGVTYVTYILVFASKSPNPTTKEVVQEIKQYGLAAYHMMIR